MTQSNRNIERLVQTISKFSLTNEMFEKLSISRLNRETVSNQKTLLEENEVKQEKQEKQNEPIIYENLIYVNDRDKLFWYLMMTVNNWDLDDLPQVNERFAYRTKILTECVELLQKTTDIDWKGLNLRKSEIFTHIAFCSASASQTLTYQDFIALCYLYEENVIIQWGKCYHKIYGGIRRGKTDFTCIKRTKGGEKLVRDKAKAEFINLVEKLYHIKNLLKPIGAESSIKLGELQEISNKLNIPINNTNGKPKKKKELYNDITSEIKKID